MGGSGRDGEEGVLGGTEGTGEEGGPSLGDGGESDGVIFAVMLEPAGFVAILPSELGRFCVKEPDFLYILTLKLICRVSK